MFAEADAELSPGLAKALAEAFVKIGEWAGKNAAKELRDEDRRRGNIWTAIVTGLVVAAICIPVTYFLTAERQSLGCRLASQIAEVQAERTLENKAATERFKRESADRLGLPKQRFDELIAEGERREAKQLATYESIAHASC